MASAALEWPKKTAARAYGSLARLRRRSILIYQKNTSNCGTYSEPDPMEDGLDFGDDEGEELTNEEAEEGQPTEIGPRAKL